jgi:hypothetical protein
MRFPKLSWFSNWRFESCKSRSWFLAKVSASIKSGIFSGGSFPNLCFFKIDSWFLFQKFLFKFAQVSKIGFKVLVKVFASKRFHLVVVELAETQSPFFMACVLFGKIRFLKSASFFQQKFWQVWFGLLVVEPAETFVRFIFSGKVTF